MFVVCTLSVACMLYVYCFMVSCMPCTVERFGVRGRRMVRYLLIKNILIKIVIELEMYFYVSESPLAKEGRKGLSRR